MVHAAYSCYYCQRGTCCTCGRRLPQAPVRMSGGGQFLTHHTATGQRLHDHIRGTLLLQLLGDVLLLGARKADERLPAVRDRHPGWALDWLNGAKWLNTHLQLMGAESYVEPVELEEEPTPDSLWTDEHGRIWPLDVVYTDRHGCEWVWARRYADDGCPYLVRVGRRHPLWRLPDLHEGRGPLMAVEGTDQGEEDMGDDTRKKFTQSPTQDYLWIDENGVVLDLRKFYVDRNDATWTWTGGVNATNKAPLMQSDGTRRSLSVIRTEGSPLIMTDPYFVDDDGHHWDLTLTYIDEEDDTWTYSGRFVNDEPLMSHGSSTVEPLSAVICDYGPLRPVDQRERAYRDKDGGYWDLSIPWTDATGDSWMWDGRNLAVPCMDQVNGTMSGIRFTTLLTQRAPLHPASMTDRDVTDTEGEELVERAVEFVVPRDPDPDPPLDGVTEDKIDRAAEILARMREGR